MGVHVVDIFRQDRQGASIFVTSRRDFLDFCAARKRRALKFCALRVCAVKVVFELCTCVASIITLLQKLANDFAFCRMPGELCGPSGSSAADCGRAPSSPENMTTVCPILVTIILFATSSKPDLGCA